MIDIAATIYTIEHIIMWVLVIFCTIMVLTLMVWVEVQERKRKDGPERLE